nr:MAG TPA: hypothetical protein [Caudoviricetes sp.]
MRAFSCCPSLAPSFHALFSFSSIRLCYNSPGRR